MTRFSRGARVRFTEEKTTGRIGTVTRVIPRPDLGVDFDRYEVEFFDGEVRIVSDLELSPAGSGSTTVEDVA